MHACTHVTHVCSSLKIYRETVDSMTENSYDSESNHTAETVPIRKAKHDFFGNLYSGYNCCAVFCSSLLKVLKNGAL